MIWLLGGGGSIGRLWEREVVRRLGGAALRDS